MSGGSHDYAYRKVVDMAAELDLSDPGQRAFERELQRVADVMHAIEWEDSGDAYHASDALALFFGRCFQHDECVEHHEIGRACFQSQRKEIVARVGDRYPALRGDS